MARKKSKLAQLNQQLEKWQAERDKLTAQIVALEAEQDTIAGSDAAGMVAKLKDTGVELEVSRRVLPAVEAEIAAIEAQIVEEQETQDKIVFQRLGLAEKEKMAKVVALTEDLAVALDDLRATHAEILRLPCGWIRTKNLANLSQAMQASREAWRGHGWYHAPVGVEGGPPVPLPDPGPRFEWRRAKGGIFRPPGGHVRLRDSDGHALELVEIATGKPPENKTPDGSPVEW